MEKLNAKPPESPAVATPPPAVNYDSFYEAFMHGTPTLDVRYRYENVDQDGIAKEAHASTLRTRLGYQTGKFYNFAAKVEVENIVAIGPEHYNSGANGKTQYPTVSDDPLTALNQAYLSYTGFNKTSIAAGRQSIRLDNERFIGGSNFRQNDQTFDAATITSEAIPDVKLFYGYVIDVNRTAGDDSPVGDARGNIHLLNAAYTGWKPLAISAYNYYLDFDRTFLTSSNTTGVRLTGKTAVAQAMDLLYSAEYAHQQEVGNAPRDFSLHYALLEPGIGYKGFTAKLGYELLSSNGRDSFQTPLATLHGFNGWADKFTTTPVNGLEDKYLRLNYKFQDVPYVESLLLVGGYHQYDSDKGNIDYGSEWEGKVEVGFAKRYTASIEYASYKADDLLTDTDKIWLIVGMKF